jgi:hypothetical protein
MTGKQHTSTKTRSMYLHLVTQNIFQSDRVVVFCGMLLVYGLAKKTAADAPKPVPIRILSVGKCVRIYFGGE